MKGRHCNWPGVRVRGWGKVKCGGLKKARRNLAIYYQPLRGRKRRGGFGKEVRYMVAGGMKNDGRLRGELRRFV